MVRHRTFYGPQPVRLVWFLSLSLAIHVALLPVWPDPGAQIEDGERFNLLAAQLLGSAESPSPPRPRHRTPNAALPTSPAQASEPLASTDQPAAATAADDGQENHNHADHARAQVISDFARYFYYPAIARQRGWEGRVVLGFRIDRDGRLQERRVAHTSGFAVLDRAALDSLNKVERVTVASGTPLDLQIPVLYRLTEGH